MNLRSAQALEVGHSLPSASPASGTTAAGGWRPTVHLGAPTVGGLSLPSAHPTAAHMYAPRGVWLTDDRLVVADSGNHRVMIWHGLPTRDEQPADVVLCQPSVESEGPAAGGRGPENGLHLPTGVTVVDGHLFVADAWHHRVLVWEEVPQRHDQPPDGVIGQADLTQVEPNRGGDADRGTLYWPYGVGMVADTFWIADTGNRRVLGWAGGPPSTSGDAGDGPQTGEIPAPDVLLGQPDWSSREENRGAEPEADSFRWPHDVAGDERTLLIADAGNHRVLGWEGSPATDRGADLVLGQDVMTTATEWPYGPHTATGHRFPYAISTDDGRTVVADTANNRLLVWDSTPRTTQAPPDHVLAQPDFGSNGENRWDAVGPDTLCWPYGVSLCGDRLAVADSGNNRVMIWERS